MSVERSPQGRAGARVDAAFAALPVSARHALALVLYKAAPIVRRRQTELEGLLSPELGEAVCSLLVTLAGKWVRGAERAKAAARDAYECMPHVQAFTRDVLAAVDAAVAADTLPPVRPANDAG